MTVIQRNLDLYKDYYVSHYLLITKGKCNECQRFGYVKKKQSPSAAAETSSGRRIDHQHYQHQEDVQFIIIIIRKTFASSSSSLKEVKILIIIIKRSGYHHHHYKKKVKIIIIYHHQDGCKNPLEFFSPVFAIIHHIFRLTVIIFQSIHLTTNYDLIHAHSNGYPVY